MDNKIKNIRSRANGKEIVFVSGIFNVLHIGHVRMMDYARSLGGYFVVGLIADGQQGVTEKFEERSKFISMLSIVDDVIEVKTDLHELLFQLKPEIVVKGAEHKDKINVEQDVLNTYGGRLFFNSGNLFKSTHPFDQSNQKSFPIKDPYAYRQRHNIDASVFRYFEKFKDMNIVIIGDVIIDEYTECNQIGMSRESPSVVVAPTMEKTFIGGAGIAAAHLAEMGANVTCYSVVGDDALYDLINKKFSEFNVKSKIWKDNGRRTTIKKRYRAQNVTLFRINSFDSHDISNEMADWIINDITSRAENIDIIIMFDFSYGVMTDYLTSSILEVAELHNIFTAADSQSSSQTGDIMRFKGVDLMTPTEFEARAGANNFKSSLSVLTDEIYKATKVQNLIITLGSDGVFIQKNYDENLTQNTRTDQLEALSKDVIDVAGAGDVFLVTSSMVLRAGGNVWEAAYLGSIASALQVQCLGNTPVPLAQFIEKSES